MQHVTVRQSYWHHARFDNNACLALPLDFIILSRRSNKSYCSILQESIIVSVITSKLCSFNARVACEVASIFWDTCNELVDRLVTANTMDRSWSSTRTDSCETMVLRCSAWVFLLLYFSVYARVSNVHFACQTVTFPYTRSVVHAITHLLGECLCYNCTVTVRLIKICVLKHKNDKF